MPRLAPAPMTASPYGAAIWDMDGTLVDSEDLHYQSWREIMADYGIAYSRAAFLADFGRTSLAVLREYLGAQATPEECRRLAARKSRHFRTHMKGALRLMPGAAAWLDAFQRQGLHQVIASSAPMASIAAAVQELDIGHYFTALLSGIPLPRSKPDPALFRQAAAAVDASADACLVLEDSRYGIEAACRAGMDSLAVGERAYAVVQAVQNDVGPVRCLPIPDLSVQGWPDIRLKLQSWV